VWDGLRSRSRCRRGRDAEAKTDGASTAAGRAGAEGVKAERDKRVDGLMPAEDDVRVGRCSTPDSGRSSADGKKHWAWCRRGRGALLCEVVERRDCMVHSCRGRRRANQRALPGRAPHVQRSRPRQTIVVSAPLYLESQMWPDLHCRLGRQPVQHVAARPPVYTADPVRSPVYELLPCSTLTHLAAC
jgi:hypothetical protein